MKLHMRIRRTDLTVRIRKCEVNNMSRPFCRLSLMTTGGVCGHLFDVTKTNQISNRTEVIDSGLITLPDNLARTRSQGTLKDAYSKGAHIGNGTSRVFFFLRGKLPPKTQRCSS